MRADVGGGGSLSFGSPHGRQLPGRRCRECSPTLQLVMYSQCLVSAVLGLEEAQHKESCCLEAQYQHNAPNEASSIKTWAVVFRDGRTPCRMRSRKWRLQQATAIPDSTDDTLRL